VIENARTEERIVFVIDGAGARDFCLCSQPHLPEAGLEMNHSGGVPAI